MKPLKYAVIGAGYLGKFHAQKYAALADCQLVAVVDTDQETAKQVAEQCHCQALTDYQSLLGEVDAVSIVVPTRLHHSIARDFLQAGSHVLLEKPMTVTLEEADNLINIAEQTNTILQVGHLERFNPAIMALDLRARPLFIESHRLSPFNPRANDVSVVLDLMIHDIDIILNIVDSEVERMDASGISVLTGGTDIANARLVFKSGCVANVTASRVSMKSERKMRIFKPNAYVSVDFQERVLTRHRKGDKEMFEGIPEIKTEQQTFEDADALLAEIQHFVQCIQNQQTPLVSGYDGRRALATAIEITELLAQGTQS